MVSGVNLNAQCIPMGNVQCSKNETIKAKQLQEQFQNQQLQQKIQQQTQLQNQIQRQQQIQQQFLPIGINIYA